VKVLAIASYGRLGGAELAMTEFLAHRPPGVDVAAVVIGSGELAQKLAAADVAAWQAVDLDGKPSPSDLAAFARGLSRVIERERPDVVWAVGRKAAIMAVPTSSHRHIPLVWWKVDFSLDHLVAKPLARAVDGVVSVSQAAAEAIGPRLRQAKLLGVVGPPVALDEAVRARLDPSGHVVGTLGTLMPIKGHHVLLRATAHLVAEFGELQVRIGGGPAREFPHYGAELGELAAELGVSDHVQWLGFTDAATFLEQLNVYVNATGRHGAYGFEGLSGAMLEASWAGVPVVATRGGGTPEGMVDGVTGTLVEPDDPQALAAAIAGYLRDPDAAARAGQAGREFARQRFAPRHVAEAMFGYLESVAR
jgi:glycosyltransferase involved in cell wall biosynthesis